MYIYVYIFIYIHTYVWSVVCTYITDHKHWTCCKSHSLYYVYYMYILYDRPQALDRLLKSLEDAEYMDDTVALEIYVDGVRDTQKLNAFYSQQNVRGYSS